MDARLVAVVAEQDGRDLAQKLREEGWQQDGRAVVEPDSDVEMLSLTRAFDHPEEIDKHIADLVPHAFRIRRSELPTPPHMYYIARSDALLDLATACDEDGGAQVLAPGTGEQEKRPGTEDGKTEGGKAKDEGSPAGQPDDESKTVPCAAEPGLGELQQLLWPELADRDQDALARSYFEVALRRHLDDSRVSPVPSAPLLGLISALPSHEQVGLYRRLALVQVAQFESDYVEGVQKADARVEIARAKAVIVAEASNQMKRWTSLSHTAVVLLVLGVVFAGLMSSLVIGKIDDLEADGAGAAIILFVLALVAVSPAVLLLLERPLKGLDQWTPGGKADEDTQEGRSKKEELPKAEASSGQ